MRLLFALLANIVFIALLPLRLLRRALAAPRGAWLEVVVHGATVELRRPVPFWMRSSKQVSLEALRELVALAKVDSRPRGILLRMESFTGGSARATSLRDVLLSARAGGLEVAAHLPHGGGTLALYVASAAHRIFVGPESQLDLSGFAIEVSYLRGALDRLGLVPEVFARGRFKTAGEFLTQKSMSDPQREQVGAVLDSAYEALVAALATGRGVDESRARHWIETAPHSAEAARAAGLVDAVLYDDELGRELESGRQREARIVPAGRYRRRRRIRPPKLFRSRYLAVVDVAGPIVSQAPLSLVPVALEESVCRALSAARQDRRALGVLVNISSRGGSVLASDRMLHEVRRVAEKKPVVAYLGDVAASGGYMVAVGAHAIIAQPTTVTGSIGVVAARLVVQPLLSRLGIVREVVKRGERADMTSPARRLDDGERSQLEEHLDEIYRRFVSEVARGRGKTFEMIEPLAGGRVYSGRDAHRLGLVDALGGFDVALAELRRRVGPAAQLAEPRLLGAAPIRAPGVLTRYLRFSRPALGAELAELGALALSSSRERAWLWSEVAELGEA